MATAPSTPRSGGHPEPLLQTTPTTAGIEAYFNSLGDDWVSTARARADSDQPAQPVDDAVGDGGGGDRMADDQDVDEDDDDADELAEDESELTDVGGDEPQSRARLQAAVDRESQIEKEKAEARTVITETEKKMQGRGKGAKRTRKDLRVVASAPRHPWRATTRRSTVCALHRPSTPACIITAT